MQTIDMRRAVAHCAVLATLLLAWTFSSAAAADSPQPPCGTSLLPHYAALRAPASVWTWNAEALPKPWVPPACLHWKVRDFAALIAVAGRIGGITDRAHLLRRLVSTAGLRHVRYWSFSRKRWRTLFTDVDMLTGPDESLKRADLRLDEIRTGQDYFMWQKENSLASGMVFRGRFTELSRRRIVFQQVNLTASSILMIELLAPKEFETTYFIDRESDGVWRYYSLTRVGTEDTPLSEAPLASLINRNVAIFRYVAGVATDREPPAAP